ncbi:MAG TPA: BlaI/MecI/CopY family transcriptional regulator [Gammaproteobacteria bacterium]|nr:BlaI/MecI/CopY family transcriptional regulator [Gammaproteobacteria bacterium]
MSKPETLSRRERQVMDAVYALGEATAKDVQQRLPDPPSYSAVRAVLTRLVDQGHLKYREAGPRYVYTAAAGRKRVGQAALRKLVDTFFEGSPLRTMNALLGLSADELTKEELDELAKAIEQAREKSK